MLRELRESLILRPKTPNQNKHQKSPSYYFSTISNNAPTKHTSRDNTVLASGDLLSFVDKSPKSILTNKYSTSNSKKNKKILNDTSIKQKQNPLSNSLSSDNFNNYDSNYYSEAIKNSKSKQSKLRTLPTNNEPKITNFKAEKEKKLSNIKEKYSIEKENSSKNKNMKK